ncbi:MAG: VanZ family protein [Phycisphaerales bacterium]|nr:VanZ family protein [Phycisphaerales bacterium]
MTVCGFAVTLVATHWPKLRFGPEAPSDKILHALTFGILTFLLWRSRVIPALWKCLLAMIAFSIVDEWTQSLAIFARHTSWTDWMADLTGISMACVLVMLPARPINAVTALRYALRHAAERDTLDRPFTWMALATSGVLGAMVGIPTTVGVAHWFLRDTHLWQTGFLGAVFFCAAGIEIARRSACRAAIVRIASNHSCFACGADATADSNASMSVGKCAACGEGWIRGQWVMPINGRNQLRELFSKRSLAQSARTALSCALLAGVFLAILIALAAERAQDLIPADMIDLWSYSAAILTLGMMMRVVDVVHRARCAAEGIRCRLCNYDLVATPAVGGLGRCPECATPFARVEEHDRAKVTAADGTRAIKSS